MIQLKNRPFAGKAPTTTQQAEFSIGWRFCPVCGNKTRDKIRKDTVLVHYPLYCPKCKRETLINVKQLNTSVIKEPDAQTQSR